MIALNDLGRPTLSGCHLLMATQIKGHGRKKPLAFCSLSRSSAAQFISSVTDTFDCFAGSRISFTVLSNELKTTGSPGILQIGATEAPRLTDRPTTGFLASKV